MKKKIVGRLGVVALTLTLVTTCLMGGTLAKYTADVKGTAAATVAKFGFNLNDATEDVASINISDLFQSAYGAGDEVKATDSSKKVVAPGTSGKIKIELANRGEVAIKPTFTLAEKNESKIPLLYAITTADEEPEAGDWKKIGELDPTLNAIAVGGTAETFYIHWKWDNTSTDVADTALGVAMAAAQVELTVTCIVEQAALTTA